MRRALFPIAARHRDVRESLGAHPVPPLVFQCFQPFTSIGAARVHGADRRTRTCAASWGPLPSGRGAALEWLPAAPARDGARRPDSPAGP